MYNEKKEIQELEFEKKIFETKNDIIKKGIDSPKKLSEYFYNMVKSEL